MPQITVYKKLYIPSAHHRQPPNSAGQIILDNADGNKNGDYFEIVDFTSFPLTDPLKLSNPLNNKPLDTAQLLFWSVTDGIDGKVYLPGESEVLVGANPLKITAWYYLISGGVENPDPPRTAIIDDAFSAAKGDFITDTFITVTSDPTLTNQANVVGIVPTLVAETLQSSNSISSTSEPFLKWISYGAGVASGNTINVPAKATGIAIAVYQKLNVTLNKPVESISGTIFGAIPEDGGGSIFVGGRGRPVGPWSPLLTRLIASATVVIEAEKLDKKIGAQVVQLSAQDALLAIKQAIPFLEKEASKEISR